MKGKQAINKRADELLHILWSKAVNTEGYDKEQWKELQAYIERAVYGKGQVNSETPPVIPSRSSGYEQSKQS